MLLLLIVTGLEVDLSLIVRKARTAVGVSLGGIMVPFATGVGLGYLMPDDFVGHPGQRLEFALFMAVAMSISAIPVIAKVLMDLKLTRRDIGQITLAAAMTDDTIGWILLSVVAGLAAHGSVDLVTTMKCLVSAVLFVGIGLTAGPALVSRLLAWVDNLFPGPAAQLSTILTLAFAMAALTHSLGIEAVLGAFVTGIIAGEAPRLQSKVTEGLELIAAGLLAPIFFASAGLKVDLWGLLSFHVASVGLGVLAVACLGKFIGCYFGGLVGGLSHWERLAMGSGMNARGAMEIIVATLGLSLGVLTTSSYSIIVCVAIVTSLLAPPMLRWTLSHVVMGPEEKARLERERLDEKKLRALFAAGAAAHSRRHQRALCSPVAGRDPQGQSGRHHDFVGGHPRQASP